MRYMMQRLNAGLIHSFYSSAKQHSLAINYLNNQRYFSTKKPSLDINERRFADPTYDDTFRRLFGEDAHKNILVNALNGFLGFTGENAIVDVEINNPALEKRKLFGSNPSITGAIDILCITNNKKKIAVEMQGKKTAYFLAREQEYMAKLISGQVPEGEGHNYHNKVLDTYIIVISKSNIFKGSTALADQTLYEVDVAPTVQQTKEIYPGNKMYWKFFELEKFAAHKDSQNITKASPLKLQWLDFLLSCSAQTDIPEDRDNIIKECYNIMDKMKWDPDDRTIHWKNIINQQDGEKLLSDSRVEGILEGRVEGRVEGRLEGIAEGRLEAKVKLLPGVKVAIEKGWDSNLIKTLFPTFEENDLTMVEKYISDNPNCTNEDLANHIGLIGESLENSIDH